MNARRLYLFICTNPDCGYPHLGEINEAIDFLYPCSRCLALCAVVHDKTTRVPQDVLTSREGRALAETLGFVEEDFSRQSER